MTIIMYTESIIPGVHKVYVTSNKIWRTTTQWRNGLGVVDPAGREVWGLSLGQNWFKPVIK